MPPRRPTVQLAVAITCCTSLRQGCGIVGNHHISDLGVWHFSFIVLILWLDSNMCQREVPPTRLAWSSIQKML